MASNTRKLVVEIVGDAKKFQGATKDASGSLNKLDGKLGGLGKTLKGAFVAGGIATLGVTLLKAGEAAATSRARIEQIAKSMGRSSDEARILTDRLVKLADATARQTGIDQNAIKLTQAKLLTFKELAASADSVGGAFDRATQAALDLAAAGFGEATANAAQLGKALQDPIKGLDSLREAGVTFTAEQRNLIRTLVETGDVAKAQDIVLKAIEEQVGGTAKATANGTDKMKVAFSQFAETLGTKIMPVMEDLIVLAQDLLDVLGPAIKLLDKAAEGWERLKGDVGGRPVEPTSGLGAYFTLIAQQGADTAQMLWDLYGPDSPRGIGSTLTAFDNQFRDLPTRLFDAWKKDINSVADANVGLGVSLGGPIYAMREQSSAAADLARAQLSVANAMSRVDEKWKGLTDSLSNEEAILNLKDKFDDVAKAIKDAETAQKRGAKDAEQQTRDAAKAVNDLKQQVVDYGKGIGALPPEKVTKILAEIDAGQLDWVEQQLDIIARNRQIQISFTTKSGGDLLVPINGKRAAGGPVTMGGSYLVGENGPELFTPSRSGAIVPNGAIGGTVVQVNVAGSVVSERDLVRVVQEGFIRAKRLNGDLGF